ncbi:MAG: enoyl-CoA hydratase/carnithine racemase [Bacteroidia bacterium]
MSYNLTQEWPQAGVAVLTFTDRARTNQLCWGAIDEMAQRVADCRGSGARVVILASGLTGHWLQHAWLRDLIDGLEGREQTGTGAGWFDLQNELAHEDIVSIAAISGDASGGGAEMAWACDLRIAERQARFAQPEVNMGLTTGVGGCSRLARLAGRATAAEMVLTGGSISAQRLYQLGAIGSLVEEGESLVAALDMASSLALKSPAAIAGLKRILALGEEAPLAESLRYEQEVFQSVVIKAGALKGMQDVQSAYDTGESIAGVHGYPDRDTG